MTSVPRHSHRWHPDPAQRQSNFLQGVNMHAEAPIRCGRANSDQDLATIFSYLKDLNANFIRLCQQCWPANSLFFPVPSVEGDPMSSFERSLLGECALH
jgi:hypothetical protein